MSMIKEQFVKDFEQQVNREMEELEYTSYIGDKVMCLSCDHEMLVKERMEDTQEDSPVFIDRYYCVKCDKWDMKRIPNK